MTSTTHDHDFQERLQRAAKHLSGQPRVADRQRGFEADDVPPFSADEVSEVVSDLIGGRVLAWLGGVATLLGIILFLVVAISRGWITIDARVALAGAGSAALVALGTWLHSRRGRTEASVVLAGAGIAGMFATLVVAGEVYGLVSPLVALGGSMLVGALGTGLAIRWAGRAVGALGLLGALASPILVGAPPDAVTIGVVALASGFAMWAVISQCWGWLGIATVLTAAAQWGLWILHGQAVALDYPVLVVFTVIGLAGAVMTPAKSSTGRFAVFPLALVALNACLVGAVGWIALDRAAGQGAGDIWLGALALVHVLLGLSRIRRLAVSDPLRRLLIAIGVVLADAAFGLSVHGIALAIGWGAAAIGFAGLARRRIGRESDSLLLGLGVGAHVCLTLMRVVLLALPAWPGQESSLLIRMLAVATLAASCLVCGQLVRRSHLAIGLNALGLVSIAYLTSQGLSGFALVAAWAFEGGALTQLWRPTGDDVARYGGLGFLALAMLHILTFEAPPTALLTGAASLTTAAASLGAVSLATLRVGQVQPEGSSSRRWLLTAGAGVVMYLVSVAIVTSFQPAAGASNMILDLGVRQLGQVILSACWSLVGVIALVVGLRGNRPIIRNGALGVLLVTVGKVFLYDLSTLTSLYRVISFVALGLLLLAGAFAYQRLRPPPAPDMRSLHPSQR